MSSSLGFEPNSTEAHMTSWAPKFVAIDCTRKIPKYAVNFVSSPPPCFPHNRMSLLTYILNTVHRAKSSMTSWKLNLLITACVRHVQRSNVESILCFSSQPSPHAETPFWVSLREWRKSTAHEKYRDMLFGVPKFPTSPYIMGVDNDIFNTTSKTEPPPTRLRVVMRNWSQQISRKWWTANVKLILSCALYRFYFHTIRLPYSLSSI